LASANHDYTDGTRANTDFSIMNGLVKAGYAFDEHLHLTIDASVAKFNANDNGPIHKPAAFNIDILRGKASDTVSPIDARTIVASSLMCSSIRARTTAFADII
jgi:hypothetical protein